MRRLSITLILALLAASLVFSTGSKEAVEDSRKNVDLIVMGTWANDTPYVAAYRAKFDEISAEDNGINIIQEMIGEETQYYNKLRTRFATGEFPNIFSDYGGARSYDYVKSGVLVDLAPYLEADPKWKNGFLAGVLEDWEYDDYPGAIYGVPTAFYCVGLFYNAAIFSELGLTPPATIKEFEDVCDKLLAAGYIPMSLGEKDTYRAGHLLNNLVMKSYGSEFVAKLGNREISYDSPQMMVLYQMIYDWNKKGYFGQNAVNKDSNMERADFHSKKTAMHFDGTWYLAVAKDSAIVNDIHFVPFPTINPSFSGSWQGGTNGGLEVVNTGNKEQIDKAVEAIKQITSPEFMKHIQILSGGGVYPIKFDSDPYSVSALSIEVSEALKTATEFRSDIQNYDMNTKMLETVRVALQGLFIGKTPEEIAAEIMHVVKAEN